jgi:hypothetical protein
MSHPKTIHGTEGAQYVSYSSRPQIKLGTKMLFQDGRAFRFASAGASTALVPGFIYQSEVPTLNSGLAVATHAVGDQSLTVTFGGAVTLNEYEEGFVWMDTNANSVVTMYKIKSHPAGTAVAVALYSPINEAILAASTVSAIKSPYKSVIIHPSSPTAMVVGVCVYPLPVSTYGWLQVKGPCPIMNDTATDTLVIGTNAVCSPDRNGEVCGQNTGGGDEIIVGRVLTIEADAQFALIDLTLE